VKFSSICLLVIVLPLASYNEYLVFSIICCFIENTKVIGAIKGLLVNPLNNKKNQRACINYEILLSWLSAGNMSKSYPLAVIVMLTKALRQMQKCRYSNVLGLCFWRNIIAGLGGESSGDVNCMSFTDGCSCMQCQEF